MFCKTSKRVSFSPDITLQKSAAAAAAGNPYDDDAESRRKVWSERRTLSTKNFCSLERSSKQLKNPMLVPMKFLRRMGSTASRAIASIMHKDPITCNSTKPPPAAVLSKPRVSVSAQCDSHHKEAIDDCIEFFNSSVSRSNSISERPSDLCIWLPVESTSISQMDPFDSK